MGIEITARHVEITDTVKERAASKLRKLVEEFPNIENVHLILDVEKYRQIAEVVVHARRHVRIETRESSTDMYASLDAALGNIEKRLRKVVSKKKDHKARLPLSEAEEKLENEQ